MGTTIRPEPSKKNEFWIDKHRYYELKHFCLQYPVWKKAWLALKNVSKDDAAEFYEQRMSIVKEAAVEADESLADYILLGVTTGVSYEHLSLRHNIPCCKEIYYSRYRKFFWILSKKRN